MTRGELTPRVLHVQTLERAQVTDLRHAAAEQTSRMDAAEKQAYETASYVAW
jgi:hypothetical protein